MTNLDVFEGADIVVRALAVLVEAVMGIHRVEVSDQAVQEILDNQEAVALPFSEALRGVVIVGAEEIEGGQAAPRTGGKEIGRAVLGLGDVDGIDAGASNVEVRVKVLGGPDVALGLVRQRKLLSEAITCNASGLVIDDSVRAASVGKHIHTPGPSNPDGFDVLGFGPMGEADVGVDVDAPKGNLERAFDERLTVGCEDLPLVIR
jgi:hypothetical protein